jgi:hypothetical protein
MIKCQICKREFKTQITNSHLKVHGSTTAEYKKRFGEDALTSIEYREALSKKRSGKNNHMYGKRHSEDVKKKISENRKGIQGRVGEYSKEGLESIREAVKRREEKYNSGKLERREYGPVDEDTKNKISESVKAYAEKNHEELSARAKKSWITKAKNGYSLDHLSGPKTEEGRKRQAEALRKENKRRSIVAAQRVSKLIEETNLTLLNDVYENKLKLKCNKCHIEFAISRQYFNDCKYSEEMCPTCYPKKITRSKGENELYEFINELCPSAIPNNRTKIYPLEIDVYLPDENIGFEYSGLYWHSEEQNKAVGRHKAFDNYKMKMAREAGVKLYIIFEDEWINNKEIVKSRIRNILGKCPKRVYARNCEILETSSKKANKFLKENHIQGSGRSNYRLGLFYEGKLISVMTFSKENKSRNILGWEINRFCHKLDHTVVGGASKLFKKFLNDVNPKSVISYADCRWSDGNLYKTLGFDFSHQTPPNYWYFYCNELKRIHRYSLRKNDNDDPNLTEYENRLKEGYLRIWDCGSTKWIYTP